MIEGFVLSGSRLERLGGMKAVRAPTKNRQVWLDFSAPTREEALILEKELKYHHLAVEDALNERQMAKVEHYDAYHFLVIHALGIADETKHKGGVEVGQLNIFLSKNLIVTVHLKPLKTVDEAKRRLEQEPKLLSRGADYVAYMLMDSIVDDIFPILDGLEMQIEVVEEQVFKKHSGAGKEVLAQLFRLRKKLLQIRKIVWPQRETLSILASRNMQYIRPENIVYFRDVYDHLIRINSIIENYRDLITSAMEGHLTVVSNSLSIVMKKLTAVSAIIMVPTLIASIYGMNFLNIPELALDYGYYASLLAMLLSTVLLALYFRQKQWV